MTNPEIPNLDGKVDERHVMKYNRGTFSVEYINWPRVKMYLRTLTPEWVDFCILNNEGGIEHAAPDGSFYLMVSFRHVPTGYELPPVPHGQDIPENASGRVLSDAYVRGVCKAAAYHFGLAWQLWSKDDPITRLKKG